MVSMSLLSRSISLPSEHCRFIAVYIVFQWSNSKFCLLLCLKSIIQSFFLSLFLFPPVFASCTLLTLLSQPFTNDFPRADIHELLAPDLLHQVIKGTFKDHLVSWVEEYLVITHGQCGADEILDDIDWRYVPLACYKQHVHNSLFSSIAAAPPFAGLRWFPEGRHFKQWTGDDSKGLMKVRMLLSIELL